MITITNDAILMPLKENSSVSSVFCLALRIMQVIAINWAKMTFPFIDIILTDNIY